ncbi:MAG: PIN domain-containing protein [Acidobacteriota bacterium]
MSSGSQTCFIDTNIWLYAFIPSQDANKSTKAKAIIRQSDIIASSQVINEICVNLIKKAQFDEPAIQRLINSFYNRYNVTIVHKTTLLKSSELRERLQLSYWDSLIVSSALLGGAEILYTEDMADGLLVENRLRITNPFKP